MDYEAKLDAWGRMVARGVVSSFLSGFVILGYLANNPLSLGIAILIVWIVSWCYFGYCDRKEPGEAE
jgi:purine-cytosine permease-like protein